MENFHTLGLPDLLVSSLQRMHFSKPTEVQVQTIPVALSGSDILGSSQTGTGKTAAFGIPLITRLLEDTEKKTTALILAPTRELALQVLSTIDNLLGRDSGIKSALLIGGDPIFKQIAKLKSKARLFVGTPGRVIDLIDRGDLDLSNTKFLVLDETDRMLDLGFGIQLDNIVQHLPKERQTMMFSATLPDDIIRLAKKYTKDAVRIAVGSARTANESVTLETIRTTEPEKYGILIDQLEKSEGSFIVFVKTKSETEKLAIKLRRDGHDADAIHGDLRQRNREKIIKSFRDQKYRILVATNVAARGLDIPHVECVVNYDLPQCPEDYIHRIGRTGRAGATGRAVNLITAQNNMIWKAICKMMNPNEKFESLGFSAPTSKNKPRREFDRSRGGPRGSTSRNDRSSGGFRPRSSGEGDFKRRDSREGGFNSSAPRGDFRPRSSGEGDFKRRDSREGGFKNSAPRGDFRRGDSNGGSDFRRRDERSGGFNSSPRPDFRRRESSDSSDSSGSGSSSGSSFKRREFGDRDNARTESPRGEFRRSESRSDDSRPREFKGPSSRGGGFKSGTSSRADSRRAQFGSARPAKKAW